MAARGVREEFLDRPVAFLFANAYLVGVFEPHAGEPLGQRNQARTLIDGHADEAFRLVQVGRHVRARCHLHAGDPEDGRCLRFRFALDFGRRGLRFG